MTKPTSLTQFTEGYEKGREDGVAFALSAMRLAIDYFPSQAPTALMPFVDESNAVQIRNSIHAFGESAYRRGKKEEKDWQKRRLELAKQEAS